MIEKSRQGDPLETTLPYGQMNLIVNFRTLWLNLAIWTRAFTFSIATQLGNTQVVSDRLYQVPVQLGTLIQLIFGQKAAEGFIDLMSNHIILLETAIVAQKSGDVQTVNESAVKLYQNADALALYLESINPFWVPPVFINLFYYYIALTFEESTAVFSGNYAKDIQIFDRLQYQTLLIGDHMANGIIQYFTLREMQP